MKVKKRVWMVMLACICCSFMLFDEAVNSQREEQAKYQVISLLPNELKPPIASISQGTTVIWVNEARGLVEIQFTNTESMIMSCGSPLGFIRDLGGQFISDMIPFAGVASLCFIKEGEFNYVVRRGPSRVTPPEDVTQEFKGKIVVK